MKRNCTIRATKLHSIKSDKYTNKSVKLQFNVFIALIAVLVTIAFVQSVQINLLLSDAKSVDESVIELCAEFESISDYYTSYYSDIMSFQSHPQGNNSPLFEMLI